MSADIIPIKNATRLNPADELSRQLRALADSLDGLSDIGQLNMVSAVVVIECGGGELVTVPVGADDWARTTGILFAAAQQVAAGGAGC